MILLCLVVLSVGLSVDALKTILVNPTPVPNWTYSDASNWKNIAAPCGGQQSPIDIPKDTIPVCLDPLHIENLYWPQTNVVLQNDYRASAIFFDIEDYPILVSGGPLPKNIWFYVTNLYFHVGVDDHTGSDHTINGVAYPMEMKIDMTSEVVDNKTSDAVLSFFIVVSADDNDAWEPIIQGLSRVKQGGSITTVSFASLAALLPAYSTWETQYYSYLGTHGTPPCLDKVIRTIYTTPIRLSERQIHAFRLLQDENNRPITDNTRRPMPTLDYRAVLKY